MLVLLLDCPHRPLDLFSWAVDQEHDYEHEQDWEGVLGGGLEPPCLAAYAPQTYVSAISPPEQEPRILNKAEGNARPGTGGRRPRIGLA